jgi:FKBP-type peptidyl-prolyl cis-trans isomerase FklB
MSNTTPIKRFEAKMNKKILFSTTFTFLLVSISPLWAAAEIKTDKQKLSYALGIYFSQGVSQQNIEMDIPAFLQAVEDVLNKSDLKLGEADMQQVLTTYQQKIVKERGVIADSNKTSGEKFLSENKQKDGVVTLPSGLQYKIVKQGDGPKPKNDSNIKVHYHGTHIDGKVFDSSYDRGEPISLSLNQVIKGWQEALPLMSVGSKFKIYVPSELAYGDRGAGNSIGPNETLIFDIELLGIN